MTTIALRKTQINPPKINQSRVKRDWMDATYNKHAYQAATGLNFALIYEEIDRLSNTP